MTGLVAVSTARHTIMAGESVSKEDEEDSSGAICGPSSDSTAPSEAPKDVEEELRGFHLAGKGLRITSDGQGTTASCLSRGSSTAIAPLSSPSLSPLQPVTYNYAGLCMDYCMTMCCLKQYGVPTTNNSIFHSKDIPRISIRHYMERFFHHPCLSPSAMLAGIVLIFRFTFIGFPVDIYSVHRLILTGASVGVKVMDDAGFGITYLGELGGVQADELIALQNYFCRALQWNLHFYPEDYAGLLEVMGRLLADPTPAELDLFRSEHCDEIKRFDVKRLRVAVGMPWCLSDLERPLPQLGADGEPLNVNIEVERYKAVLALHRWDTIMEPWLDGLKQRCERRERGIEEVMLEDAAACARQTAPSPRILPSPSPAVGKGRSACGASFPHYTDPVIAGGNSLYRPPSAATSCRFQAAPSSKAQPRMEKLIYARPFVRSDRVGQSGGAVTTNNKCAAGTALYAPSQSRRAAGTESERLMIGQKRSKPSAFKD